MEPEAKYTVVGGSVLVLVALLAAALFWLYSSGQGTDARRYAINFRSQSLEGLEPRSNVTMRGIRVGSVTGFRFSSQRPGTVEVFVEVEPTTPVLQSTRATVERHLVTGLASIRLVNETELSPPLALTPPGAAYPVIAEGESTMQQVSATLTQLAERTDETMQHLNAMLSPENRVALTEMLDNLSRVARRADGTLTRADAAIDSIGGAANDVREMAASISRDVRALTVRYDALGSDARVSVRALGEALRNMSADVERLSRRADTLLANGDVELRDTAQSLRSAADAVGAAAARLRDPSRLIYGPAEGGLGPGERAR